MPELITPLDLLMNLSKSSRMTVQSYDYKPELVAVTDGTIWRYKYTPEYSSKQIEFTTDKGVNLNYITSYMTLDPWRDATLEHLYLMKEGTTHCARRSNSVDTFDVHYSEEKGWWCTILSARNHDFKLTFQSRTENGLQLTYTYTPKDSNDREQFIADGIVTPAYFAAYMKSSPSIVNTVTQHHTLHVLV